MRHLPQGHQLLPLRMGRTSLCRHHIRHRNRQTTDHRCPPSHSPNLEWLALASCSCPPPIGVSNYDLIEMISEVDQKSKQWVTQVLYFSASWFAELRRQLVDRERTGPATRLFS